MRRDTVVYYRNAIQFWQVQEQKTKRWMWEQLEKMAEFTVMCHVVLFPKEGARELTGARLISLSLARARALSATGPYHSVTETGLWGNTWPCHYLAALALFPLPLLPFVRFLTFPFHTMRREIGRVYLHPASTHVWHAGFRLCLTLMKGALCLLRRGIQAATFCGSWMCVRRCANIFFLSLEKQRKGKRWSFKVYLLLWGDALPVRR